MALLPEFGHPGHNRRFGRNGLPPVTQQFDITEKQSERVALPGYDGHGQVLGMGKHGRETVYRNRNVGDTRFPFRCQRAAFAAPHKDCVAGFHHLFLAALCNLKQRVGGHDQKRINLVVRYESARPRYANG